MGWPDRNTARLLHDAELDDALAFILGSYDCVAPVEAARTGEAAGRILAGDLIADVNLPRFDASAVDGYAFHSRALSAGSGAVLEIAGRSAAGHPYEKALEPGMAVRILTGAQVPEGADLVAMQEHCVAEGGRLRFDAGAMGGANIRKMGEDVMAGTVAVCAGTRLRAGHVALAAALGRPVLPVYRRLQVALFSTGDELEAAAVSADGQIVDANRPMLKAFLQSSGCTVDDRGILRDDPERQIAALMAAAADNDLIVTTGGMSVGDEDHLPGVIRRRGYLEVWKLRIKPGRPIGLGDIDDCPILALPGNPAAAAVTFMTLGVPLVARLSGQRDTRATSLRLPLTGGLDKKPGRWEAVLARLVAAEGGITGVEALPKGGSARLGTLAAADGFIMLPAAATHIEEGAAVDFVLFPG